MAKTLPDLDAWNAEMLRVTAFHRLGQQSDRNLWEEVTGSSPESKVSKPREGGYEVSGPCAGGVLTLRADPARIDWLYTVAVSMDKPLPTYPTVGPFPDALNIFSPLMSRWLQLAPSIVRLAFGAVLLRQVSNRIEGYEWLDAYLPHVEIEPIHSSDFLYQINRHHVAEAFDKLHVNRVSKWSVAQFLPLSLQVTMSQVPAPQAVVGDAVDALRVDLDMNTDALRQEPLPKDKLVALLNLLESLGKEIAKKGDIT